MKLRFLTSVAGDRFAFEADQVIEPTDMDEHLVHLLNSGVCEVVRETPESAVVRPRERAVTRRSFRGRQDGWPVVPKLIAGGLAVCIGGGPSLTADDVNAVKGKALVVAVNDAYRLAPWADVLYAADARWWEWHKGVPEFQGLKYSLQPDAAIYPNVQILRNTGQAGLELQPNGLRTGRNGGYQAINLAVHLGATRILLLGYDMQATGGQQHWFGEHPRKTRSNYASFREFFGTIVDPLRAVGVEVINCSRETALDTFPRMALEDALALSEAA